MSLVRHVEIWVNGGQKQRQDCERKSAETNAVKMLEEGGVTLKLPCQMMLIIVLCSPAHQSPCLYSADTSSSRLLSNGHTFFCLCLCACKPTATFTFHEKLFFILSTILCFVFCLSDLFLYIVSYHVPVG